jgi:hypothetical protein
MHPCQHTQRTVPSKMNIKAEGSQEIVGVATLRVCWTCGHVEGTVTTGSLFNPKPETPFTVEPNEDIGVAARKALLTNQPN